MNPAPAPEVIVHRDAALVAEAVAARLITALVDAQAARGNAHVVLTGGGVGTATLAALAAGPARDAVAWDAVHVWWGDERFLPDGDPDRNVTQARAALLDRLPLDPKLVHPMPASGAEFDADVDAAARAYAQELAAAAGPARRGVPAFDVVLLGVGPDGHVASLFADHPALQETFRTVLGVRGSPKPPPVRISLTLSAINQGSEVWLLAAGAEKAAAVAQALGTVAPPQEALPAARVSGVNRTLWLIDRAAAGRLGSA